MQRLHEWFHQHRRAFPWRTHPTPYRVWISEIMLQQTRAAVVVPYFERWMTLFPDIFGLAAAPVEAVIKAWEGLGYYSRARNLHIAARQIVERFKGELPAAKEKLEQLKGLGPYTVGAILSFGFHQRAAAVDGNVLRVLSRYFAIEENVSKIAVRKKIEEKAEELLDSKEPWVTAEAFIELGATVCTMRPRCEDCPLQGECLALQTGKQEYLPIKDSPMAVTHLHRIVLVIVAEEHVLVRKGAVGKVMADLYEFPYYAKGAKVPQLGSPWPKVEHTFTRFKAHLYPYLASMERRWPIPGCEWVRCSELLHLPFSSGHRKIARTVCELCT
ncbi:MAG: A/G-specific adenine glycosylase [Chlamydiia bacterium]|nr:A/G-specific adenine glycosylase [Chlamydiia bacterium]